jgi:hypothetical protein
LDLNFPLLVTDQDYSINNWQLKLFILNFIIFNLNHPIYYQRLRLFTTANYVFLLLQMIQILNRLS